MGRLKQVNRKTPQSRQYWQGCGYFVPPEEHIHWWVIGIGDFHTAICTMKTNIDWQNIDIDWQVIGNNINTDSTLLCISLQCYKVLSDEAILQNIFNTNTPTVCPIQSICLQSCNIRPGGIGIFLPWLNAVSHTLTVLRLDSNRLGDIGATTLSELLQTTSLEHLSLRHNDIGDRGVESLLDKRYSSRLQVFDIGGNRALTETGVIAIKNYLCNETSLKVLHISVTSDDNIVKRLIRSLPNVSSLTKLCLDYPGLEKYSTEYDNKLQVLEGALLNLVCDTSSLDSLVKSNHTITKVKLWGRVVNKNCNALAINNRDISEVMKMREKIVKYFMVGSFDLQPFLDLDVELMPNVIEMVGMKNEEFESVTNGSKQWFNVSSGNLNEVYRLVRFAHMPEMISFISPEKKITLLEEKVKQLTLYCERVEERGVATKRMKMGE